MGGAELDRDSSFITIHQIIDMNSLKFAKYYHQKKQENPNLTDEQIAQDYEETQQGKQARNTRLLGG